MYCCGPSSGISSGSSGDNRASRSARSTVRRRLASSSTFVVAEARRRPIVDVTVSEVSVMPPDVVISAPAKRVLPLHPVFRLTRVSSAFAIPSTRSVSVFAWSRVRNGASALWKSQGSKSDFIRRSSPC